MTTEAVNAVLEKIFYNPDGGFMSASKLYEDAKEKLKDITLAEVNNWYKKQSINQRFSEQRPKLRQVMQVSTDHPGRIQADLIDISNVAQSNGGNHWILTAIDLYSRFAWAFPIKTKHASETLEPLQKVFKEVGKLKGSVLTLTTDDGGEFKGPVAKWLEDNNIPHYIANPNDNTKRRTANVEAFNRTLIRLISKNTYSRGSTKFIDILPDIIHGYNDTTHSVTGFSPASVLFGGESPASFKTSDPSELKLGDLVRIRTEQNIFSKKQREPSFSNDIYIVTKREGYQYEVINYETLEPQPKMYLQQQLLLIERPIDKSEPPDVLPEVRQASKDKKIDQTNRRELNQGDKSFKDNILTSKRVRTPSVRLKPL